MQRNPKLTQFHGINFHIETSSRKWCVWVREWVTEWTNENGVCLCVCAPFNQQQNFLGLMFTYVKFTHFKFNDACQPFSKIASTIPIRHCLCVCVVYMFVCITICVSVACLIEIRKIKKTTAAKHSNDAAACLGPNNFPILCHTDENFQRRKICFQTKSDVRSYICLCMWTVSPNIFCGTREQCIVGNIVWTKLQTVTVKREKH